MLRVVRYSAWGAIAVILAILGYVSWQGQGGGDAERFATTPIGGPTTVINQQDAKVTETDEAERFAVTSIGGPFTLINQHGAKVTEADFEGHPTALFFGYTFCPDVCPTTLFEMTQWLAKIGPDADKLKVYFVTVDPQRDTQELLAAYLAAFDPRITGLTGSSEAIAEMTKAYRIHARKVPLDDDGYIMDHTASIYLLNSDAVFTGTIAYAEDPEIALAKLRRLIDAS